MDDFNGAETVFHNIANPLVMNLVVPSRSEQIEAIERDSVVIINMLRLSGLQQSAKQITLGN